MAYTEGQLLVSGGLIRQDALRRALAMRDVEGGSLGENLIRLGVIDEVRLATFYHKRLVLPLLEEASLKNIPPAVLATVPAEVAAEFRVLPVTIDRDDALVVVMADPANNHAVDEVTFFVDRFVVRAVATESAIRRAIERHYRVQLSGALVGPTPSTAPPTAPVAGDAPRPAFIPTNVSPPLPAASEARAIIPPSDERAQDPFGRTAVGKKPLDEKKPAPPQPPATSPVGKTEEVVVLTKKKRSEETPLPPPAPGLMHPDSEPHLLTQPRNRGHVGTLPGLHPDAPSLPLAALRAAADRDEVARILVEYAAKVLGRAALFVVRAGSFVGFDAQGGGLDRASVQVLRVPLSDPTLFGDVARDRLTYRGAIRETPHDKTFFRALETGADRAVIVLPILVRDRVVALLFGDRFERALPEADLQTLCHEAGLAYERIILQARATSTDPAR